MTASLDDFHKLEGRVKRLQADAERARGAYQADLEALAREFGVSGLAAAKKLLADTQAEEDELRAEYARLKTAFDAEYLTLLQETE